MKIAAMRARILFQENSTEVDDIGNHQSVWTDYFSCWATVSGPTARTGSEGEEAGQTTEHSDLSFTVRYSSETAAVGTKTHRILYAGDIYDIVETDPLSMGKRALKFRCRKVRR